MMPLETSTNLTIVSLMTLQYVDFPVDSLMMTVVHMPFLIVSLQVIDALTILCDD